MELNLKEEEWELVKQAAVILGKPVRVIAPDTVMIDGARVTISQLKFIVSNNKETK